MQLACEREDAAQRTKKAAIGALCEEPDHQQRACVKDIGPGPREMRGDGGVEGLDLSEARACFDGQHGGPKDDSSRNIFSEPQIFLRRSRRIKRGQANEAGKLAQQVLQGAEGAEPAAKHAAPKKHERE